MKPIKEYDCSGEYVICGVCECALEDTDKCCPSCGEFLDSEKERLRKSYTTEVREYVEVEENPK